MSLKDEIARWDGKSKEFIADVFDRYRDQPGFLGGLVDMLDDAHLQSGATWLLKHHFDKGGERLDENLAAAVYSKASVLVHWDARLHVLQSIAKLPIPESEKPTAEAFVRRCLVDDVKFVRAWAYSGFCELARRFPEFQPEAVNILNKAMTIETAGSVLARVRRELRRGF